MKYGRGVLNSFFFLMSFIGDYVFQRDLHHEATRLDHQVSEKQIWLSEGRNRKREDAKKIKRKKDKYAGRNY